MIIPVRCFTCGTVLADKWIPYIKTVQEEKSKINSEDTDMLDLHYIDINQSQVDKSVEGKVLDELDLHKYCCRRMMLGNVHIISYFS